MRETAMTVTRHPAPVREQVVEILRNAILTGRFTPGQRLFERELVGLLGASRTTVREGLRHLEAEGLVRTLPGKGPVVASVTASEAAELYEVRAVLEGMAARLFAERATNEPRVQLEDAFRRFEESCKAGDLRSMLTAKDRFYEILFTGCGNSVLRDLVLSVNARIARLRSLSLSQPGRSKKSLKEVKAVLNAIRRRDPNEAERASMDHVRSAGRVVQLALRTSSYEPDAPHHLG